MQTGSWQSLLSSLVLTSSISKSGQHPRWKNKKQCYAFIKLICPVALTLCSTCFTNKERKVLQWLQPEVCHSLVHDWTIFAWSGSHGFQDTQGVLQPGTTAKASCPANSLHAIMPGWKKVSLWYITYIKWMKFLMNKKNDNLHWENTLKAHIVNIRQVKTVEIFFIINICLSCLKCLTLNSWQTLKVTL